MNVKWPRPVLPPPSTHPAPPRRHHSRDNYSAGRLLLGALGIWSNRSIGGVLSAWQASFLTTSESGSHIEAGKGPGRWMGAAPSAEPLPKESLLCDARPKAAM
ncbi:hypothetical protein E2C01_010887 [Portunus trituberculatus]|uniref:Uncharacterized protein n=1 Tax=Portunus trituberculatus TaxID=210409 RepID=A0A5B7D9U3_PORTR|nr:hypothetical protein [Portunus trituberculatus]